MFVLRASGSLAISEALWPGTHGFASHGYPWFAFVNGTRRFVGHRMEGVAKSGTPRPAAVTLSPLYLKCNLFRRPASVIVSTLWGRVRYRRELGKRCPLEIAEPEE